MIIRFIKINKYIYILHIYKYTGWFRNCVLTILSHKYSNRAKYRLRKFLHVSKPKMIS